MEPWYKVATPRKEVREGRSFNPDEFAIALEQVVSGRGPRDYCDPIHFFARTCFTRALEDILETVGRRLAGETASTAPVLTLVTQFGGGKTHALTALYHTIKMSPDAEHILTTEGREPLLELSANARFKDWRGNAKAAVFVGNAWDPQEGRETPWIDVARQLAGDSGVEALGRDAKNTPPGTGAISRVFQAASGPVLLLFDEVLNFLNRHRAMAEPFHAFLQNLTVATTGTTRCAAVISLPRSQVEMTEWDLDWQGRITKVVRRVAKDLIANDEAEIAEVVRRRLFEDLGSERVRKNVARAYSEWCFQRRAELPPEWTAVDTAATEAKAREYLQRRFEACYPFHPATLSVFQRKWQSLAQYQQTRGTLAMFAQWISTASQEGFRKARTEPLITLGSAPLDVPEFRAAVLGQLGEPRLSPAIETDIAGEHSHSRALDADTSGPLRDIHRRVGAAILFESSGGQIDKVARRPELRFALGEPDLDTTSVDNAAYALESKAFFISRVGSDGFKIYHKATIRKAVSDRRASLDEETEIRPTMRKLVEKEFERGATVPLVRFPEDDTVIQDSPKLTLVLMEPDLEWAGAGELRERIAQWTKQRGRSSRLYPAALVWCLKKPGRELRDKVELWLAWKRVAREVAEGILGADYDRADRADIESKVRDAEEAAKDEVWGGYRFVVLADSRESDGLKAIDLGAGHASGSETLCGRVIAALKSNALLNESVGAGYIDRNWPPALKESGAWPLTSLRQSFLNGALTRLIDPDTVLRGKIVEFVSRGDFGLGSGQKSDGGYDRLWFGELMASDEVAFEPDVYLLTKSKAQSLRTARVPVAQPHEPTVSVEPEAEPPKLIETGPAPTSEPTTRTRTLRIIGSIPPELWNRLGTKLIPKLRSGSNLRVGVDFSVTVNADHARHFEADFRQALEDLGLAAEVRIEQS
jgi:hypothetical protein